MIKLIILGIIAFILWSLWRPVKQIVEKVMPVEEAVCDPSGYGIRCAPEVNVISDPVYDMQKAKLISAGYWDYMISKDPVEVNKVYSMYW